MTLCCVPWHCHQSRSTSAPPAPPGGQDEESDDADNEDEESDEDDDEDQESDEDGNEDEESDNGDNGDQMLFQPHLSIKVRVTKGRVVNMIKVSEKDDNDGEDENDSRRGYFFTSPRNSLSLALLSIEIAWRSKWMQLLILEIQKH